MIKYPNGKIFFKKDINNNKKSNSEISISASNRGMDLENDINLSNEYYLEKGICLITKRPTPINVVKVDYSNGCKIVDAYFEKQSTTDYNGIYKGKYIDFEAKNTQSKTSFPLSNICDHQLKHLQNVIDFGGLAFFIIQFSSFNEVYLLSAQFVLDFIKSNSRKSISYNTIKEQGIKIKQGYNPRLSFVDAIDELFFRD